MLKLNEEQLAGLDRLEKRQYVDELRKQLIQAHPELEHDGDLKDRLERAYWHALDLGFRDGGQMTRFLCYEAFAPGFHREPAIRAWLTKPGRAVEQRFTDLLAQMKSKLGDR